MHAKLVLVVIAIAICRAICLQVPKVPNSPIQAAVNLTAADNSNKTSEEPPAATASTNSSRKDRALRVSRYKSLLSCVGALDFACAIDRSEDLLEEARIKLLAQADAEAISTGRATQTTNTPSVLVQSLSNMMVEVANVINQGFGGFFRIGREEEEEEENAENETEEEEEEDDENEEEEEEERKKAKNIKEDEAAEAKEEEGATRKSSGVVEQRGKKKKKKIVALIKLLILGAVLKAKLGLLLKALAVKIQIKFLLIALAGLLLNAARFWLDLKKGHQPQKVIYYEHAQHQHHYEGGEDDWSSPPSGGGGSWWGRTLDVGDEENASHNLAYSKQRPTYISRVVTEKPSSFWG